MADLPSATQRWLADHHGVVTSAALRQQGVGRATLIRLVDADVLRRAAKGVFVATSTPQTPLQLCAVLCAAHSSGFVTGPTAGSLAGLRRMPRTAAIHFSVRHGLHLPVVPGVHFRQTTALSATDRISRHDGILVASWPRLAFDLAADLRQLDHQSVVQQLLHERRVTTEQLVAIDRRLGHPARPGSGVFLRTLQSLGNRAPNQSHPEVVLATALRRRGVPVEHQVRVVSPSKGYAMHVDLAVPGLRWGVEVDVHPEHRTLDGVASDAVRRRELHLAAWQIETVTESDLVDLEPLVEHLVALYHARRRELSRHPSVS